MGVGERVTCADIVRQTYKPRGEKPKGEASKAEASKGSKTDGSTTAKSSASSDAVFTVLAGDSLKDFFYIDPGASAHLVPSQSGLRSYVEFSSPLEIPAANNGKILTYGSGTARVSASVDGVEREADLEEVFYVPDVHVRLLSLGKLESQGWGIPLKDGGMELRVRHGDLFAVASKVNNLYPMELTVITPGSGIAAWMDDGEVRNRLTRLLSLVSRSSLWLRQQEVERVPGPVLLTWHRRLGHPFFKAAVELARSGVSGMAITDVPALPPE